MPVNDTPDQDRQAARRAKRRAYYKANRDAINERRRRKRQIRKEVEAAERELRDANSRVAAAWFSIGVFK